MYEVSIFIQVLLCHNNCHEGTRISVTKRIRETEIGRKTREREKDERDERKMRETR